MNKEELNQKISTLIESYIKDNTPEPKIVEKPVEKVVEKVITVPNDKIILSADIFSKIINIISFAENQNLIDSFLEDIYADVKKNRTSLSKAQKEKPKRYERPRQQYQTIFDILNNRYGE